MICFRCGSDVPDAAPQCPNCGQRFAGTRRTFTATTTSFRALERRRLRASKSSEGQPFSVGDVVDGRYEVRDLIGRGPLGVVYRVHDQEIELDVALKVMHDELLPDPADRLAFAEAVRRVRKLSQQNIVRIYDHAEADGHCFFTMQLLEGLTLRKVMGLRREREQRFSVREVEPIFNQITMALGHAHRHTLHGNLKPENIIILPDVLKLTDFGSSAFLARDRFVTAQREADRDGYLAPELIAGEAVDGRADIYSLGALLYELLTGRPFSVDAPPASKVLEQPEEARPGGIDRLISQATARAPTARFDTAESFAEALGTYIDARELVSVDIRASTLLPEDITRKFAAPKELADDDEEDAPTPPPLPVLAERGAPAVEPSEESFVEALSSTDLDHMLDDPAESVDRSADPALPIMAPPSEPLEPFGGRKRAPLPAPPRESEQTLPVMDVVVVPPPRGPWLLRSNLGFVLSIMVVVGAAAFVALHFIRKPDAPVNQPAEVQVVSEAAPMTVAALPEVVAPEPDRTPDAARPVAVVSARAPESLGMAAVATDAAPESLAMHVAPVTDAPRAPATEAPATAAPRAPVTEAPRAPVTEAPRAPVTDAPKAPATEAPKAPATAAPRTEAPKAPATEAPRAPATAAPATAAPETVAARAPATAAPETDAPTEPVEAAATGGDLRCPPGMILVRTGRFPKNSGNAGVIKGAEGVALARAGNAFCIDVHEFPGRGQRPRTSVSFTAAAGLCKDAGKRLCSDSEWLRACVGRGGAGFPYGKAFDALVCNTEDENGDERSVAAAGSFGRCRSAIGAYDMSGNVAEWTADQTVRGGDFASADEDASCRAGGRRSEGSARASIGLRCCSDFKEP